MKKQGLVCVFEGPDGVGKTTVVAAVRQRMIAAGYPVLALSFPGSVEGTLGAHIHELHHRRENYNIVRMTPDALQILHVAAHVDALQSRIRQHVEGGGIVLLDRYWWSTLAYGRLAGVQTEALDLMVKLERHYWRGVEPRVLFLMTRPQAAVPEERRHQFARESAEYGLLQVQRTDALRVIQLPNAGSIHKVTAEAIGVIEGLLGKRSSPSEGGESLFQGIEPVEPPGRLRPPPEVWSRPPQPLPTQVFDTYWRFAAERQAIFFRRLRGNAWPWTDDAILKRYKFTNAYRASDRVSQFLIRHVIYAGDQSPREVFFRTILFKLFNRIETWQHLVRDLGELRAATFNVEPYDKSLTRLLAAGETLYSGAYIMPTGGKQWHQERKHRMHLHLLDYLLSANVSEQLERTKSMREAFELLRSIPTIGDFLAYQYVIDLNYSTLTDFQENEFVSAGPGAREGIRKCFASLGGLTDADVIRLVRDRQEEEFHLRDLNFESLWGRPLQLIDCQNLFCEVDKYARVSHPEVRSKSGRSRIKQQFRPSPLPIEYWYPPKWGLNERIEATHSQETNAAGR